MLLWVSHATATDNRVYQAGEYVIISDGRSPDGRWSIAAYGEGEYGDDNFDLSLMREPAHEKLATLRTGDHLDTGPLSIVGIWSPDSSRVVILYRSDRHVLELRLFGVTDGKLRPIDVPLLVKAVGQPHLKSGVHRELFSRLFRVTWQKSDRFTLEEWEAFDAHQTIFRSGLEPYLKVDQLGLERTFTYFAACARCEITKTGKLRLLDVKPGANEPPPMVYSPYLRFDSEHGLYDTETTLSSLAKQKAGE